MGGKRRTLDLTPHERQVLDLLVFGKENADIALVLGKSPLTVKNQVATIIRKMHVENRTQAVAKHLAPHLFHNSPLPVAESGVISRQNCESDLAESADAADTYLIARL